DGVAADAKEGRRALEHGDMGAVGSHGGQHGGRGGPGADDHDPLALVVEILRPRLRVDDATPEVGHTLPLRRVAFRVAVVALAHPQEVGGEVERLAGVEAGGLDGPEILGAGPARAVDAVAVANVAAEVVLVDDLLHVAQDLGRGGDGRARPRLEAVAEGIEVAIGADAGKAVGDPGPSEAALRLEHDEAGAWALPGEVVGSAHAGDAGADDQHIEMLNL